MTSRHERLTRNPGEDFPNDADIASPSPTAVGRVPPGRRFLGGGWGEGRPPKRQ